MIHTIYMIHIIHTIYMIHTIYIIHMIHTIYTMSNDDYKDDDHGCPNTGSCPPRQRRGCFQGSEKVWTGTSTALPTC